MESKGGWRIENTLEDWRVWGDGELKNLMEIDGGWEIEESGMVES